MHPNGPWVAIAGPVEARSFQGRATPSFVRSLSSDMFQLDVCQAFQRSMLIFCAQVAVTIFDLLQYYQSCVKLIMNRSTNLGTRGWQAWTRLMKQVWG